MRFPNIEEAGASASGGTTVTNGGTNTKGSYAQLLAASAYPAQGVEVQILDGDSDADYLVDIAVGASGSEVVLFSNMPYHHMVQDYPVSYRFMVPIAKGTRIAARSQGNNGGTLSVFVRLLSASEWDDLGSGDTLTIGASTTDSGGTSIDPGGTVNTKGAWVELTLAALVRPLRQLIVGFPNQNNAARSDYRWLVDIGQGASGSQVVAIPDLVLASAVNRGLSPANTPPYYKPISAGARVWARAACSGNDATDRLIDVIAIGVS